MSSFHSGCSTQESQELRVRAHEEEDGGSGEGKWSGSDRGGERLGQIFSFKSDAAHIFFALKGVSRDA